MLGYYVDNTDLCIDVILIVRNNIYNITRRLFGGVLWQSLLQQKKHLKSGGLQRVELMYFAKREEFPACIKRIKDGLFLLMHQSLQINV